MDQLDWIRNFRFYSELTALPFIEEIWLYGSRARGDHQQRSDIDLAILCPKANLEQWRKIKNITEEGDTLLKVDCVRFDQLAKEDRIHHNILQFKKVIYKKNGKK